MALAIKRNGNFFELTGIFEDVTMEEIFRVSRPLDDIKIKRMQFFGVINDKCVIKHFNDTGPTISTLAIPVEGLGGELIIDGGFAIQDDETGATFWPTNAGACFNAGNARFRVAGVDLSAFAASGDATHVLVFHTATHTGMGYIGPADSAYAEGGNLLLNGDFELYAGTQDNGVNDSFTSWTRAGSVLEATATSHGGSSALEIENGGANLYSNVTTVEAEKQYILEFWTRDGAVVAQGYYAVYDVTHSDWIIPTTTTGITGTTYTKVTSYFITPVSCVGVRIYFLNGGMFDDASLKEVTNVGTDGVLLYSEATLDTQSLAYAEAGINYNAINSFEVYLSAFTYGTGWIPGNSKANKTAGIASDLVQDISAVGGNRYKVIFTVSGRTAGSVTPDVGGTNGTTISADGTYTQDIICGATDTKLRFEADATFDGSIDTVSVKEVIAVKADVVRFNPDGQYMKPFIDFSEGIFNPGHKLIIEIA